MTKERRWLVRAIRNRLLPAFQQRGFELVPVSRSPGDRELIVSFPFGSLRRKGPQGFDTVEIQLISYGGAAFRINAGVIPFDGIDGFNLHLPAEEAFVSGLNEFFEIYQYRRLWGYLPGLAFFSIKPWQKGTANEEGYYALIEWVISLIPEVELALREGKCGPHVRHARIQHPRPQKQTT